jgi:hypothetical protein
VCAAGVGVRRQEFGDGAPDGVHHVVVHPRGGWEGLADLALALRPARGGGTGGQGRGFRVLLGVQLRSPGTLGGVRGESLELCPLRRGREGCGVRLALSFWRQNERISHRENPPGGGARGGRIAHLIVQILQRSVRARGGRGHGASAA